MGNVPDAVLHSRHGVVIQEQSYKMPVHAAVMMTVSICIWNLPFETPHVLLGNGPTVLQVASLGLMWGAVCVLGGYFYFRSSTQLVTIDFAAELVTIRSHDYQPEIPLSAIHCIQVCVTKTGSFQTNLAFRDAQNRICRHCLYSHVRSKLCLRLAHQYQTLCGFQVVDSTAVI